MRLLRFIAEDWGRLAASVPKVCHAWPKCQNGVYKPMKIRDILLQQTLTKRLLYQLSYSGV